jgi:hypothetical protein
MKYKGNVDQQSHYLQEKLNAGREGKQEGLVLLLNMQTLHLCDKVESKKGSPRGDSGFNKEP